MGNSKSKRKKLKINTTGLLILCKDVIKRPHMILFGQTLEKGHDPIYCCSINTETETETETKDSQSNFVNLPQNMPLSSQRKNDKYFYKLIASKSLRKGTQSLLQLAGMQSIKPNTVIIGFKRKWETDSDETINEYVQILSDILIEKQMGIIICCGLKRINWFINQYIPPPINEERFPLSQLTGIDIWCIMDDGGLCILVPYIMSLHPYWKNHKLNLKIVSNIHLSKINKKKKEKLIFGFIHQNKMKKKVIPKSIILIIYSFYSDDCDVDELIIKQWITKYNLSSIYDEPQIITAQNNEPQPKTIETFEALSKCKLTDLDQTNIKKWLIFYELLFKHSADLNVISSPILTKDMKPTIYMALLQMMSNQTIYPPTIFIRGNEKLTQTIYSK